MKNADMPAMPFTEYDGDGVIYHQHPGLTKRELFAAMAMQGLMLYRTENGQEPSQDDLARWSVSQADALLAALGGGE